jgi:hypothetical protein
VEFDGRRFVVGVTRASERTTLDSLDIDRSLRVLAELRRATAGWKIWDAELVKVARLIMERKLSPAKVAELIETVIVRRRTLPEGHKFYPRNPGALFLTSVKRELKASRGIEWSHLHSDARDDEETSHGR